MVTLLQQLADDRPNEFALADRQGALTWDELDTRVNRWVRLFREYGMGIGDRLAFVTGNERSTVEAVLACLHAGITAVPINWHLTAPEIAYILANSGSTALLVDPAYAPTSAAALADVGDVGRLRVVTGGTPHAGFDAVEPLLARLGAEPVPDECSGSTLLYTSGTTGKPKGVVSGLLTTGAPLATIHKLVRQLSATLGIPKHGRNLLVGPWYHSGQLFFSLFPLLNGCSLVLRPRFDAADLLDMIDRERITMTHLVPTHFARLLRLPAVTRSRFGGASLELVLHGAAPCAEHLKRTMIDWWGPVFAEYYAATEGGIATVIDTEEWLAKPGSVGRAVPGTEVVVIGPDGREQPPLHTGTVYLRRAPHQDFKYHKAPDKTARAHLAPGTFSFGDCGHLDEDGFLYLSGRQIEMIVSGGVNIYPAEVETVLLAHPAVQDAAVFGIPDSDLGERVAAMVELVADGPTLADPAAALDRHCRQQLAGFKVPRVYDIVARLPRQADGKVRKRVLQEPYWRSHSAHDTGPGTELASADPTDR